MASNPKQVELQEWSNPHGSLDPDDAARWMYERLQERGSLNQREAADHLLQFGDERLAYVNHDDSHCVGALVLARFRRFPDVVYDRRSKGWIAQSSSNVAELPRALR